MDIEHEVICAIVDAANFAPAINNNITEDWFSDEQHHRVFVLIRNHQSRWGEMPSRAAIKKNYPGYRLPAPSDTVDFLINELRQQHIHSRITDSLLDIQDALTDGDPLLALALMQEAAGTVSADASVLRDVALTKSHPDRMKLYREYRDNFNGGLRGLPTGFRTLDQATMGLQPEQFITCVGLPKSGKSTLLLVIAIAIQDYLTVMERTDEKVLVIGFEMSNAEQAARYDAFTAGVSHHALMSGGLTKDMESKMQVSALSRDGGAEIILAADPSGMTTLSGIQAKIREHKPVICLIDGAYLLDDETGEAKGSSQALTNVTRGLKRMAQQMKIPILCTTQALASRVGRRTGVVTDSIGYTSSFAQDSDLLLAVMANEDDPSLQTLRVADSRIGPKVEVSVIWNWADGVFTELTDIQPVTTEDTSSMQVGELVDKKLPVLKRPRKPAA